MQEETPSRATQTPQPQIHGTGWAWLQARRARGKKQGGRGHRRSGLAEALVLVARLLHGPSTGLSPGLSWGTNSERPVCPGVLRVPGRGRLYLLSLHLRLLPGVWLTARSRMED